MSVSFGDMIRRGREVAGLSQARVAQLVGKSATTVRSWEFGRTKPGDAGAVSALAAVLGMDETALLERAGFEVPARLLRPSVSEELSSLATPRRESLPPLPLAPSFRSVADAAMSVAQPGPADSVDMAERESAAISTPRHLVLHRPPRSEARPARERRVEEPARAPKVTVMARPTGPTPIQAPTTLARSYLEDPEQRDFYRRRAAATGAIMVFLVVMLWWAVRNTGGAIGDVISSLVDALNI